MSTERQGQTNPQEDTSGGEGSGGDEELLQIGCLQKSRIETRLGDPGKEFEDLISSDHPPNALRNTILALVLVEEFVRKFKRARQFLTKWKQLTVAPHISK